MKLDRYIFGEVLRPSLLGLGFYTFVLVMNQLFLVVRQAMQRGSALTIIAELLALALPKILVLTVPMALLLGVLIGLGRLSADSEIVALRAAGVSYVRLSYPVLALGVLGFAATALIYNIGVPWANGRVDKVRMELLRKTDPNREIRAGVFYDEIPDTLLYAEQVVQSDPVWPLRGVFIETDRYDASQSTRPEEGSPAPVASGVPGTPGDTGPAGSKATQGQPLTAPSSSSSPPSAEGAAPVLDDTSGKPRPAAPDTTSTTETLVCGNKGRVEMAPDGSQVTFVIDSGEIHHNDPDAPQGYQMFRFQKPMITVVPITGSELLGDARRRSVMDLTFSELVTEMKTMTSAPNWQESPARTTRYRKALLEMNWRFAVPGASIAFCLLGFPLGLINHRGGKASGFALSLIVIMLFWVALNIGGKLASEGKIPPAVGAWGPDALVLATAGGLLLARQRRDVFSLPSGTRAWARFMQSRIAAGGPLPAPVREPRPNESVYTTTPAPRIRLTLVDLYLAKRYLMIFSLVLLSASTMYIIVELKDLIDSLIENRFQAGLVLKYLAYFSPGMMKVVMPVAAVVAALITLGSMCRANEDTALKAAGVSIFRISAPLLIVTFILSGVYFVLQDYIAPYSNQKAARIRDELEGRVNTATIAGMRWTFGRDSRLYGYAEYDGAKQSLQGVSVIDFAKSPFRVASRIWSPRVRWIGDRWVAMSGWKRQFRDGSEGYLPLQKTPVPWPETPEDFARQERFLGASDRIAEEMNFFALRRHIDKLKNSGLDTTRLRVALYEKLAFPAAPLVMVMIGLPFGFRTGRRGSLYGLGIALMLIIAYWSAFAVASALGEDEILPPLLAAWAPNLIFALAGSYLFLSTRS